MGRVEGAVTGYAGPLARLIASSKVSALKLSSMVSLLTALYLEAGEGFSALFACFRLCRIEQPHSRRAATTSRAKTL